LLFVFDCVCAVRHSENKEFHSLFSQRDCLFIGWSGEILYSGGKIEREKIPVSPGIPGETGQPPIFTSVRP
jgi:hypothetical protein